MKPLRTCPTCHRKIDSDKTVAQRNKFHAICRALGKELGETPAHIKESVKMFHFGTDEWKIGDKWYRGVKSSEDTLRLEYSELVEAALRWGAENGVYVPDEG